VRIGRECLRCMMDVDVDVVVFALRLEVGRKMVDLR
jgi:hypothetical protein